MNNLNEMYGAANLTESKYGQKFDQYYGPFRHENKKIKDKNGKELCECTSVEMAKELSSMLTDYKMLRELCEKIVSLPNR